MPFGACLLSFYALPWALSGYALLFACCVSVCAAWLLTAVCVQRKVKKFLLKLITRHNVA